MSSTKKKETLPLKSVYRHGCYEVLGSPILTKVLSVAAIVSVLAHIQNFII